jgi:hypothetical protein
MQAYRPNLFFFRNAIEVFSLGEELINIRAKTIDEGSLAETTDWQRKSENRICYGAESLTASTHQVVCPYLGDEGSRQFKGSMIRGLYYSLSTC